MSNVLDGPSQRDDSLNMRTQMARIAVSNLTAYIGDCSHSRYTIVDGVAAHHPNYELAPHNGQWGELALNIEHEIGTILELVETLRQISANKGEHPCWQESSL
jgi:hypothetical protein